MFRRSVLILVGFCLLVLFMVVGWALTGLSGPDTAIQEAREDLQRGRVPDAIRKLDLAEQSLGPGGRPELRRELLSLRAKANLATQNHRRALNDLELLVEVYAPDDADLAREHMRVLILGGRADEALRRALAFLRTHPKDARTLELAGEASQALYQERLQKLLASLSSKLPPAVFRDAVDALRPYLYRAATDPGALAGRAQFEQTLHKFRREAFVAQTYQADLDAIRTTIAQAQDYYRQSLESPGLPVSAYRGLAFALTQGDRHDDVIALSEIYLRRFDHVYTTLAATKLTQAHLSTQRYPAAIEAAQRFLPLDAWRQRLEHGKLDSEVRHLLLAQARALRATGQLPQLNRLTEEMREMIATKLVDLEPESSLIEGYRAELAGDAPDSDRWLGPLMWHPALQRRPVSGDDYFVEAASLRVAAADREGWGMDFFGPVFKKWILERGDDPAPHLARAKLLIKFGKAEEALIDATNAYGLVGQDEETLSVYAQAADLAARGSGRDARGLLQQCLALGTQMPREVAHNTLYLTLAQRALADSQPGVAMAAARRAAQLFNWAKAPRYLWAEAAMQMGRFEQAVEAMESLREYHPNDVKGLTMLRDARQRAGLSTDDLLYDIALSGTPDTELAGRLMLDSMRRRDWEHARRFARHIAPIYGGDPHVQLLVADTLTAAGNVEEAKQVLLPMYQMLQASQSPLARDVVGRYLLLEVGGQYPGLVTAVAGVARDLHHEDARTLVAMATGLERFQHYQAAKDMLQPLFTEPKLQVQRTGQHYVLAGRLALQLEQLQEAEQYLTAALSFKDGRVASKALALLLYRQGRTAEAQDAYWQETPSDLATAVLAFRLGRTQGADQWLQTALQRNVNDLGALCLQALRDPAASVPEQVRELAQQAAELLGDALMYPEALGFEEHGLRQAKALRDGFPTNEVAVFLHGRALAMARRFDQACEVLRPLAERTNMPAAWDELIRVLAQTNPSALEDPKLLEPVALIVASNEATAPARLRALALTATAKQMSATVKPSPETIAALAKLWTEYAVETRAGLAEFEVLAAYGRLDDAMTLLDHLEQHLTPEMRPTFLQLFGAKAQALMAVANDPQVSERLVQRVRERIEKDGPVGALVHLLLDHEAATRGPLGNRQDEATIERVREHQRLLEGHLALFKARIDIDMPAMLRTLERLEQLEGTQPALERIESLLRADPSLVPLWLHRARRLEADGRIPEALAGLRWLRHYLRDDAVLLETCRIAGEAGCVTAEDEERLLRDLEPASADTPAAWYARGLVDLRMGRYEQAAAALQKADPRPDGGHLWFQALARLSQPGTEPGNTAAQLLHEFATSYPDSRLSEIAPHLATQMAMIPAAAAPSPPNGQPTGR